MLAASVFLTDALEYFLPARRREKLEKKSDYSGSREILVDISKVRSLAIPDISLGSPVPSTPLLLSILNMVTSLSLKAVIAGRLSFVGRLDDDK